MSEWGGGMLRMKVKLGDRIIVGDVEIACEHDGLSVSAAHTTDDAGHIVIGDIRIIRKRGSPGANMTLAILAPPSARILRERQMAEDAARPEKHSI